MLTHNHKSDANLKHTKTCNVYLCAIKREQLAIIVRASRRVTTPVTTRAAYSPRLSEWSCVNIFEYSDHQVQTCIPTGLILQGIFDKTGIFVHY